MPPPSVPPSPGEPARPDPIEPSEPAPAPDGKVLYDFSTSSMTAAVPEAAVQKKLLARVVGKYLPDGKECDTGFDGSPEDARKKGALKPYVTMARGAFTKAGGDEVAYLVDFNECGTGPTTGLVSTRRLVIEAAAAPGKTVVEHTFADDVTVTELLTALDVDGDGRHELLCLAPGVQRMGYFSTGAVLVSLAEASPKVLGSWTALESMCEGGEGEATRARISYTTKDGAPVFREEEVKGPCEKP
jgi:hypothetical protein